MHILTKTEEDSLLFLDSNYKTRGYTCQNKNKLRQTRTSFDHISKDPTFIPNN